jgi:hypothetical protein
MVIALFLAFCVFGYTLSQMPSRDGKCHAVAELKYPIAIIPVWHEREFQHCLLVEKAAGR